MRRLIERARAAAAAGNGDAWSPPADTIIWLCAAQSGDVSATGTWGNQVSGWRSDATLVSGAVVTGAGADRGLVLASNGDYAELATSTALNQQLISVVCWAKPVTAPTTFPRLVDRGATAQFGFFLKNTGELECAGGRTTEGTFIEITASSVISWDGTWVHCAFVLDGTYAKLYLNASEVHSAAVTTTNGLATSAAALTIGQSITHDRQFLGRIDDVIIANRALSQAEITDIYTNSPGAR